MRDPREINSIQKIEKQMKFRYSFEEEMRRAKERGKAYERDKTFRRESRQAAIAARREMWDLWTKPLTNLRAYYKKLCALRKEQMGTKPLDHAVTGLFRRLRARYNIKVLRQQRRDALLMYLKKRNPKLYHENLERISKHENDFYQEHKLTYKDWRLREAKGENYKEFWSAVRHFFRSGFLSRFIKRSMNMLGKVKYVIAGLKFKLFFVYWDDPGIFLMCVAFSLIFYFVFAALLKKVAENTTHGDYFCSFKKNQVFFDYDRGGFVFYGIFFMASILVGFYLFLLLYQALVWFNAIPLGLISFTFVRFWIYYITFFNTVLLWFFFNNLRPYYYSGAQKIYWSFVFFGVLVLIVWGASVGLYLSFCFVLLILFSSKPIYGVSEGKVHNDKGFDIVQDKKNVRMVNNTKTISAIVAHMSRSKRK